MKQSFDFLCFSSTDWDELWGSRQQIMSRLAKRGHRIFFVGRPSGIEHILRYPHIRKNKIKRWKQGIQNIADNVWLINLPPLFPGRYYSTNINMINQWITYTNIKRQLSTFEISSAILWIYNPEQSPLIGKFDERLSIYHCIDEFTAGTSGRKRKIIACLEKDLLQRVDIVLANSLPTYQNKLSVNLNTYRLSSGVDYEQFSSLQKSEAISSIFSTIPHPRLGYVGNLNERIDFKLLEGLATHRPSWSFVFVGGTYPLSPNDPSIKRLKSIPNCFLLGSRPYQHIPAIIDEFDVCFLPYVQDERAYFRSPLKLYEYFATGKPVVSPPLPEPKEFSDVLYLANTLEQFISEFEKSLNENNPLIENRRKSIACQNSWDNKVDFIESVIQNHIRQT